LKGGSSNEYVVSYDHNIALYRLDISRSIFYNKYFTDVQKEKLSELDGVLFSVQQDNVLKNLFNKDKKLLENLKTINDAINAYKTTSNIENKNINNVNYESILSLEDKILKYIEQYSDFAKNSNIIKTSNVNLSKKKTIQKKRILPQPPPPLYRVSKIETISTTSSPISSQQNAESESRVKNRTNALGIKLSSKKRLKSPPPQTPPSPPISRTKKSTRAMKI